jgi:Flp pilus assembly protein TadD
MRPIALLAALALAAAVPAVASAQGEDGNAPASGSVSPEGASTFGPAQGWREYLAATRAMEAQDYAAAQRHARTAARLAPGNVEVRKLLGDAQIAGGDWRGAARTYATAVRLAPTDPAAHAGLGVSLARLNDPKAQAQLDWLTARSARCAGRCPNAATLETLTGRVRTALNSASASSP